MLSLVRPRLLAARPRHAAKHSSDTNIRRLASFVLAIATLIGSAPSRDTVAVRAGFTGNSGTPEQGTAAAYSHVAMTDAETAVDARNAARVDEYCAAAALDGATDNTACVQAAVNALCIRSPAGGTVYFPAGHRYTINAATGVTIGCQGVTLAGDGWGDSQQPASRINVIGSGTAPILRFASTTFRVAGRYASGCTVRDLMIDVGNNPTTPTRTGPAIALEKCEGALVTHVRIWAPYVGVRNFAGLMGRVTETQIDQVSAGGTGILIAGSDRGCADIGNCATRSDVFRVDQTLVDAAFASAGSQPDCIHAQDFAATVWIVNTVCGQTRTGLIADCPHSTSIAACPSFISMYDFESEANDRGIGDGRNIDLRDVAHFVCLDCQLFGYGVVNNVSVRNERFHEAGDVQFIGGKIGQARQSCIVSSATNTYFGRGISIWGCGSAGPGYHGIELLPLTVPRARGGGQQVKDLNFCTTEGGAVPTRMGAVRIAPGAGYNSVSGNIFRGCGSGVSGGSAAAHDVVANNAGP